MPRSRALSLSPTSLPLVTCAPRPGGRLHPAIIDPWDAWVWCLSGRCPLGHTQPIGLTWLSGHGGGGGWGGWRFLTLLQLLFLSVPHPPPKSTISRCHLRFPWTDTSPHPMSLGFSQSFRACKSQPTRSEVPAAPAGSRWPAPAPPGVVRFSSEAPLPSGRRSLGPGAAGW